MLQKSRSAFPARLALVLISGCLAILRCDADEFRQTTPDALFSGMTALPLESGKAEESSGQFETTAAPETDLADVHEPAWAPSLSEPAAERSTILPANHETSSNPGQRIRIADAEEDLAEEKNERLNFRQLMQSPFQAYRSEQNTLGWIPGSSADLDWLDWQTDPYLPLGRSVGMTGAINVHWIDGPIQPAVPSRVYDFIGGIQVRNTFSDVLSCDLAFNVGVFSDFEGSAKEGVRFPAHAVGMLHVNRNTDFVFGMDYLDRPDIRMLPVVGVSLRNVISDRLRMDLVFPRPRLDVRLSDHHRVYLAGQLGGGTWDMEYPDETDDVVTMRDYRLLLGFESADSSGGLSSWEFGYVFGRQMEFGFYPDTLHFPDAFVIQWVSRR
ncbi:MAG: hypothetical protein KDA96_22685 [Planctomycetaceae bacterium]|nr:hypothetical protein [Planctomycetaceae bacterium]